MARPVQIWNFNHSKKVSVPNSCLRLCAQCLDVMRIDHYVWVREDTVDIMFLCEHKGTSRFKRVQAVLDRNGKLS